MNSSMPPLMLRDIHLPDPIHWWPPALGWWMLLSILTIIFVIFYLILHRINGYKLQKSSIKMLNNIESEYKIHQNMHRLTGELSALLRRVSLALSDRQVALAPKIERLSRRPSRPNLQNENIAGLTGEAWLHFLERNFPNRPFSQGPGRMLILFPFQREEEERSVLLKGEINDLLVLCRSWLMTMPRSWPKRKRPNPEKNIY